MPNADAIIDRFNAGIRKMVADRSYHRFLHVDWIVADVDGDGVTEYVPQSDRVGTLAPRNAYAISTTEPASRPSEAEARLVIV